MAFLNQFIFLIPTTTALNLYCDRDEDLWPRDNDGNLKMVTKHLDLLDLLSELDD